MIGIISKMKIIINKKFKQIGFLLNKNRFVGFNKSGINAVIIMV